MRFSQQSKMSRPKRQPTGAPAARRAAAIVAGLTLLALTILACRLAWKLTGEEPLDARTELIAALAHTRLLQGRLTGGFKYAPAKATVRDASSLSTTHLRRAAIRARRQASTVGSIEAFRITILLKVLAGRLPEAATVAEAALRQAPRDAALASDLSAIYLEIAHQTQDPYQIFLALAAAERAVKADDTLPEARFNRALALGDLAIDWEAQTAWVDFLRLDQSSGWAKEAQANLRSLRAARPSDPWAQSRRRLDAAALTGRLGEVAEVVASDPQAAREYVEQVLLPGWGEAYQRKSATARLSLDRSRSIANALAALNGEHMPADAVAAIDAALRHRQQARLEALAIGHTAFRMALEAKNDPEAAINLLTIAGKNLSTGGSSFQRWAILQTATCNFWRSRYDEALNLLAPIEKRAARRYPSLQARGLRLRGMIAAALADYSRALAAFNSSAAMYREIQEIPNLVALLTLAASIQQFMGNAPEAWRTRSQALHLARRLSVPPYVLLEEGAIDALSQGQPRIALCLVEEGLRVANTTSDPAILAEVLRTRAAINVRLGRKNSALGDLGRARHWTERLSAEDFRRTLFGDLLAIEAQTVSDPLRAADLYTAAIAVYQDTHYHIYLAQLHQRCALAYVAANDDERADAEYRAAIFQRERQRTLLPDERERMAFFDDIQSVYKEMSLFQLTRRKRPDLAFDYQERSRARVLLDLIARDRQPPLARRSQSVPVEHSLTSAVIRQSLPSNIVLIAYSVLDEQTIAWTIRRGYLHAMPIAITSAKLDQMVDSLRRRQEGGLSAAPLDSTLFGLLLAPILNDVPAGSRLVILPDRCLSRLPFAALKDPNSGRYLIQDHPISLVPSATVLIASLHRLEDSRLREHRQPRVLLVGNPTARGWPSLPAADKEVAAIGQLYAGASTLLTGASATKEAFLAALAEHGIVHFGGHAVSDPESPQRSRLIFADNGTASGALLMSDLLGRPLHRTRLVVLAACVTGSGQLSASEGPLSLARPLLADGVPAVVASLWEVEDGASIRMFTSFYRRLHAGADAVEALRSAQLELLECADPNLRLPRAWAGFELFGYSQNYL